ncbi:hypothetical protein [Salipaludibacillus sp. CF4.18]|uniref:hypothetical protein n=1 Tax=Salipaludibacillus sp. CF4.18 TaxID=3373081 RepID=UPI003EE60FE9
MKIPFEVWVRSQNFSADSRELFEESIQCFRVSAYRGAYLLSYVGFLVVIKERLLNSAKPHDLTKEQWENEVLKKIRDENKWEEETYNILNKTDKNSKSKYFLVNTHLLSDLDYLKRRRNDCAHAKETQIEHSHVEVLWVFLQSHLSKFVVNGGEAGLKDKIREHYDPVYTEPNSDPEYLINDIPMAVEKRKIPDFLAELAKNHLPIELGFIDEAKFINFWRTLIYHDNKDIHNGFISFLKKDQEKLPYFLYFFPDQVQYIADEPPMIRYLWKKGYFYRMTAYTNQYWELPVTLLRGDYIPEEEKEDFINNLIKKFDNNNLPKDEQTSQLKKHGFFFYYKTYLINELFREGRARYIHLNDNSDQIMYYFKNGNLDREIIEYVNKVTFNYSFGRFKDDLDEYISKTPSFIKKYQKIIQNEEGLEVNPFFKENYY